LFSREVQKPSSAVMGVRDHVHVLPTSTCKPLDIRTFWRKKSIERSNARRPTKDLDGAAMPEGLEGGEEGKRFEWLVDAIP
jgi:hypothetical protein